MITYLQLRIKSGRLQAKSRAKCRIFKYFLFSFSPKFCLGEIFSKTLLYLKCGSLAIYLLKYRMLHFGMPPYPVYLGRTVLQKQEPLPPRSDLDTLYAHAGDGNNSKQKNTWVSPFKRNLQFSSVCS